MTVLEELMATVRAQQHTIEILTAQLEETTAKLEKANARIAELEEQLHKNSHNSSKPPSSDGFEKPAPKSQRKKSGKKAGGQSGHKGHHMMMGTPDRIETVYPQHCVNCPHRENCAKLRVHDTCYAVDVVIRKETVRYEIMECNCGGVQEVAKRPAGISGTVTYGNRLKALVCVLSTKGMVAIKNLCEIIQGLTGIKPSTGTVCNMLHSAAVKAKTVVECFPQKLHKNPVVHCDETGLRVNGKLHWVHVISTSGLTYYALSEKRGKKAMDEIGFLASYQGIVVHDFWAPYFKATGAEHAMCCAHLMRELTAVFENHPEQTWAQELYSELLSMYRAATHYNQNPEIGSREHYMECLKRNYDRILEEGTAQNPIPEKAPGKRGRVKRGRIRSLIDRLRTYKGEVCRFADNPIVPFTNNQAERDLRMVRMKSKVIGTFRSEQGANDFLTIKSLTSTAAKAGSTAFDALLSLFHGHLLLGD